MQHTQPIDFQLQTDYLAEEGSPGQVAEVERWLEGHPERQHVLRNIESLWTEVPQHTARTLHIDRTVRALEQYAASHASGAIVHGDQLPQEQTARERRVELARMTASRPRQAFAGHLGLFRKPIIAAIGAALVAAVVFLGYHVTRVSQHVTGASQQYATENGGHARVPLPDGSVVVLGNASTLSVAADFGVRERVVTVAGEAYLTVSARADVPFIVVAGNAITRVLGTAFVVRTHTDDSVTQVIVTEGKVSIRARSPGHQNARSNEAILVANTLGQVSAVGQIMVQPEVSVGDYTAWLDHRVVFRETPIRNAIRELERAYDVTIEVTDTALLNRTITLDVSTRARPITDVLNLLSPAIEARYTQAGTVFTLIPDTSRSASSHFPRYTSPPKESVHVR